MIIGGGAGYPGLAGYLAGNVAGPSGAGAPAVVSGSG